MQSTTAEGFLPQLVSISKLASRVVAKKERISDNFSLYL